MMGDSGRLQGKVALVTGGAQGIGEGIARVFAEHGAAVVLTDIQTDNGEKLASELGPNVFFRHLDVRDADEWQRVVADIVASHGRLDILVNNAGGGIAGPIERTALEDHRRIVELNLDSVWIGTRAVVPAMTAAGRGSVINISSIDGLVGVPHLSTYVATKFAVTGMTRSLALELGDRDIRVNSIHPGIIETPLVGMATGAAKERLERSIARQPIRRMGQPREIGHAALFFASDESAYCTGASLVVDGGHIAGPYREPLTE
jgi:3alpha(or 20beta)-hydroxysteroid dehydrogenase